MVNISVSNYNAKVSKIFDMTKYFVLKVLKTLVEKVPIVLVIELDCRVIGELNIIDFPLHELGQVFPLERFADIDPIQAVRELQRFVYMIVVAIVGIATESKSECLHSESSMQTFWDWEI